MTTLTRLIKANLKIDGMDMRDYFAGQVISACWNSLDTNTAGDVAAKIAAECAYLIADAMVKRRQI
tara:strand:+ start:453 stop:650 length:198 start_codon:yes stop_codon:yes gene_type:complete